MLSHLLRFAGNGEEKFEFRRELVFRVKAVREVDASNTAVRVNLDSQRLNIVGSIGASCEVRQVELNLVPPFIQSHRHCADKRFHASRALVVRSTESAAHVFIVKHLHLEREVFLELRG